MRQTVRFWHYASTPVLIKMRAGQTLRHTSGGPTDEGWSLDHDSWTFDGRAVVHTWVNDGADCDGRLTQYGKTFFYARDAFTGSDVDGVTFPAWKELTHGQRDYSAEAAGY